MDREVGSIEKGVRRHEDLRVWRLAIDLSLLIYRMTEALPKSEVYGLTSQIRRSAVSIAANVAEGSGRRTTKDLVHFLTIARGSLRETETYLVLIEELGYVTDVGEVRSLAHRVGRELSALLRSLAKP